MHSRHTPPESAAVQVKLGQPYLHNDYPPEPDDHQSLYWLEKAHLQGRSDVAPLLQKVRRVVESDKELADVREERRKPSNSEKMWRRSVSFDETNANVSGFPST